MFLAASCSKGYETDFKHVIILEKINNLGQYFINFGQFLEVRTKLRCALN